METWHASLLIMPSPSLLSVMTGHRLAYEESKFHSVVSSQSSVRGYSVLVRGYITPRGGLEITMSVSGGCPRIHKI